MTDDLLPWIKILTAPIGGLFQIGYADGRDLLMVHSAQGRGIFDALTGSRLDRDDEEPMDRFDCIRLEAPGFGGLAGQTIRMAGLFGGGLPLSTRDGFRLEERAPRWPTREIHLHTPDRRTISVQDDGEGELRAFGFSQTGQSFAIATSADVTLYHRPFPPTTGY